MRSTFTKLIVLFGIIWVESFMIDASRSSSASIRTSCSPSFGGEQHISNDSINDISFSLPINRESIDPVISEEFSWKGNETSMSASNRLL